MTTLKMPEPIGYVRVHDGYEYVETKAGDDYFDKQALRDVLEQAAQLFNQPHMEYFGQQIQDDIRALKEQVND